MRPRLFFIPIFAVIGFLFVRCAEKTPPAQKKIYVKNTMDKDRSFETVSLSLDSLGLGDGKNTVVIVYDDTQNPIPSQIIDSDGDGSEDTILFQPEVRANAERSYSIIRSNSAGSPSQNSASKDSVARCYSRFVPERTDDYAWENDRVAFRTYGPTAQKMVEDGVKGGTLSSGIDAWLKRVDYPIINKWYKKELETDGSYHEDTGEGLDNFHVGISRGVGGIAVKDGYSYAISKNFTSWKRLYNGPIRTSFILIYADWDAAGKKISEEKHISLDQGSNLSRFEVMVQGVDTISAGLTLHNNEGVTGMDETEGWMSYWEPHEGSELGTGIVVPDGQMVHHEKYGTDEKDQSNFYANLQINEEGKAVYYAGFGWKKSGQFETRAEWEEYLAQFAEKLKNPLIVNVR